VPTAHRLGFAVKVLGDGGLPSHDTRRWQSGPHLRHSLELLGAILERLERDDIRMYRLPTQLAPYATLPGHPEFHGQVEECADELAAIGERVAELGIRLSSHPGQYTVLNSENPETQRAAAAELEVQGALFDAMGLGPEAVVVLHVGGAAGGADAARGRFEEGFGLLSDAARRRLVIENDDRTFGLVDVLPLARAIDRPVVFDVLHHHCHDPEGLTVAEALPLALDTWPDDVRPKIHYSSPRTVLGEKERKVGRRVERTPVLPQLRAHADTIDPIGFEELLRGPLGARDVDVMLEAKAKDLALLALRDHLVGRGFAWRTGELLV
jgi:UV DNA damage endonuclease